MIQFTQDENGIPSYGRELIVDSPDEWAFSVVMRPSQVTLDAVQISLKDPTGAAVDLSKHAQASFLPVRDQDSASIPATVYTFNSSTIGRWTLNITAPNSKMEVLTSTVTPGYLTVWNHDNDAIHSHVLSLESIQNEDIGIASNMVIVSPSGEVSGPIGSDKIAAAKLDVLFPDGHVDEIDMHDDGLHGDGEANDNVYGASLTATQAGSYVLQANMMGTHEDGTEFARSGEHIVQVVPPSIKLSGSASLRLHPFAQRAVIDIGVTGDANSDASYSAYAEVHGSKLFGGSPTPVAWASAIVDVTSSANGQQVVSLEVDFRWFLKALAVGPVSLQGVYIQDADTLIPLDTAAMIPVKMDRKVTAALLDFVEQGSKSNEIVEVTEEMLRGIRPAWLANVSASNADCKVLFSHGLCASKNPWRLSEDQFPDSLFFLHADAGMSNNEFAQRIGDFAASSGASCISTVGHSQGGMATTTLFERYWSYMDHAGNGRMIQSVGTPWSGNGAGGWADLLGSDCPLPYDLTTDGAPTWLATISADTRSNVYFFYTQYKKGPFANCNSLVNLVLSKPNDGATENKYAILEGANNMGLTYGQCHIEGMNHPASFLDRTRNADMFANAARN
jgi:ADP-dependent glucokinase